jgi:hypothetical protein
MTFTLTFSTIQNGLRVPLLKDGQEVTLIVEADSKTATYSIPAVKALCDQYLNDTRIRGVN